MTVEASGTKVKVGTGGHCEFLEVSESQALRDKLLAAEVQARVAVEAAQGGPKPEAPQEPVNLQPLANDNPEYAAKTD